MVDASATDPSGVCPDGADRGGRHRWEILPQVWRCLDCGAERAPRAPSTSAQWPASRRGRPPKTPRTGTG